MPELNELPDSGSGNKALEIDLRFYDDGVLRRKTVKVQNFPFPHRSVTASGWLGSVQRLVQEVAAYAERGQPIGDRTRVAMKVFEAFGRADYAPVRNTVARVMVAQDFDFPVPLYDEAFEVRMAQVGHRGGGKNCDQLTLYLFGAADGHSEVRSLALSRLADCMWESRPDLLKKILQDTISGPELDSIRLRIFDGTIVESQNARKEASWFLDCLSRGCNRFGNSCKIPPPEGKEGR